MYIEKKIINNKPYFYAKISVKYREKVKTKTIAYLGKDKISKEEIKKRLKKISKKDIEKRKKEAKKEIIASFINWNKFFIKKDQLLKLQELKKLFIKKLKLLDKKIIEDMFNDYLTYYIYNTNAIEGNTLTLKDTDLLLNKGITPQGKNLREINDHINAKEVFNFILGNKNLKINHKTIVKLHSMLMENIDKRIGYRKHEVRVFGAAFKTTPAKFVKTDMDLLLKWYRKNKIFLHPLILVSIFHSKFERIHPFYDGNGRIGRLLVNLILLQNNFPLIIVSNAQRKKYYDVLTRADQVGLTEIDEHYKNIVQFFYFSILKTWNTIFNRWG